METISGNNQSVIIDATRQSLGRVASRAAACLRGKHSPTFEREKLPTTKVKIVNASKLKLSPEKREDKMYKSYSGYPGGLRLESLGRLIERRGYEPVFRLAVRRMLPDNKLRARMLKNLTIEN